uniref:Uncharacterized protein n=2 Tax=Triticum urartu TaxID=4572 RepID=A0A8R7R456_TRIUA
MEELLGTCNCQFKSMGGVVLLWVLRSGEGEEDEGGGRSSDSGDGLGPPVEGEGRTATARHLPASFAASSPSYPLLFVLRDTAPATVACCLPLPSLHANHCLTRLVLNIISGDPCFQIAGIEGQKRYICRGAASVAPLLPKGKVKKGAYVVFLQLAARIAVFNLHKNAKKSFSETIKDMYLHYNERSGLLLCGFQT